MPGSQASIHLYGEQVENLYIDLRDSRFRVQFGANKTLRHSAKIVNAAMREDAAGHFGSYFTPLKRHKRAMNLPAAVSDEMIGPLETEIGLGPKPGTAGSFAHLLAYGSANNAPVYDYTAGLRRSQPIIDELFGDMGEEAVLGGQK